MVSREATSIEAPAASLPITLLSTRTWSGGDLGARGDRVDMAERFWAKVRKTETCWLWTGCLVGGYGQFSTIRPKRAKAHRLAYEMLVGPIPSGLTLDHLCRNRACVRPSHLEPVTDEENRRRGNGFAARNARKMACKRGHKFTKENTYLRPEDQRECVKCRLAYHRKHYAKAAAIRRRAEEKP